MGRLNNVPIAYTVKSKADLYYLPLAPGHFLMGSAYAELQPLDAENTGLTNATRCNGVCSVLEPFGKRLVEELTTHLNGSVSKTRGVRIDDVALLLDLAGRGAAPLVRMARVRRGTNGEIRRMVCFDGFTYFDRKMTGVVVRCSTTGAVHLDMIDCVDTSGFLLAVRGLLALRPRPSVFIADGGTSFKGGDSALQDIAETKGAVHLDMIDCVDTSGFLLAVERLLALRPRPSVFYGRRWHQLQGKQFSPARHSGERSD
jgi:hypothetical protein